jgi:hypothetical protein
VPKEKKKKKIQPGKFPGKIGGVTMVPLKTQSP